MANSLAATTCDAMISVLAQTGGVEKFMGDPDGLAKLMHFTDHDELDPYDAVDPQKHPELLQEGKVILITGAGRGIGRGIAETFAKANAKAIFICARTESQLQEVQQHLQSVNPNVKVHPHKVDVTAEADVQTIFKLIIEQYGTIDVVISNSGTNVASSPFMYAETEKFWTDYETNVKGNFLVAKHLSLVLQGKPTTLIHISSTNALFAVPYQAAYASSKLAAMRLMECLHIEQQNIRVFSLHPGFIETETSRSGTNATGLELKWRQTSLDLPGSVALWLTTPQADFLRGRWISTNWRVDELHARKDEIVGGNLLKTAINAKLGV